MTVIGVGDMKLGDGKKFCGIVIEGTRKELQEIAGDVLYREVMVMNRAIANEALSRTGLKDLFKAQLNAEREIKKRLEAAVPRKYSRVEVLEIMDELLDGIREVAG